MELQDLWFWLICVLWAGYFVLEGFDFGVGMLVPALGRSKQARDELFETIGPLWDGNEVWLIVAVGATLAAFPLWYATMFSAFYLVVLLLLLLLILRIVSFEWRERSARPRWHGFWTGANVAASYGAPFLWGLMFANLLQGVPIDAQQGFTGNLADQLSPYSLFAGLAFVAIFAFHGATYLGLRTRGALLAGAQRVARRLAVPALLAGTAFVVWTLVVAADVNDKDALPGAIPAGLAVVALVAAALAARIDRDRLAFACTAGAILMTVVTVFLSLFPRVMVSSTELANSLTVDNAAAANYSLTVITIVAAVLVPVVVAYQVWTYRVFRARVGGEDLPDNPLDLALPKRGEGPAGPG